MVNSVTTAASSGLTQYSNVAKKHQPPSAEEMFSKISSEVGGDGKTISKEQLDEYISKTEKEGSDEDKKKLGLLKQLSSNFDSIAGTDGKIDATDLKNNMDKLKPPSRPSGSSSANEPQDPSTVTSEQLEPPIDLRV